MHMVAVSYGALGCNNIGGATESPDVYSCSVTEDAVVQMGTVAMSQGAAIVQMGMAAVSLLFSEDGGKKGTLYHICSSTCIRYASIIIPTTPPLTHSSLYPRLT